MMNNEKIDESVLADLVDGTLRGPEWELWLAVHPEAAAEVEIARRVRAFMTDMRTLDITVSDDFEARLMARIREDNTLLDFLEFGLNNLGRVIVDLLNMIFSVLPLSQTQSVSL